MIRFRHYKPNEELRSQTRHLGWSLSWGTVRGGWTLDFYWLNHVFVMFRSKY
jgi:hypothetical protein